MLLGTIGSAWGFALGADLFFMGADFLGAGFLAFFAAFLLGAFFFIPPLRGEAFLLIGFLAVFFLRGLAAFLFGFFFAKSLPPFVPKSKREELHWTNHKDYRTQSRTNCKRS